ncbi:MAG: MGMT family protein [Candidatus Omnitrophica bacterium]|nr:MGMT family protein [Candidatus Omnitrophota bacterium]
MAEAAYRNKIRNNPGLTKFQKKVLLATLDIPRGEIRSYAWVAKKAASPRSARAVGQVMAINPYPPHVPCHRVIAGDGSIGGYSLGPAQKRRLLKREGVIIK